MTNESTKPVETKAPAAQPTRSASASGMKQYGRRSDGETIVEKLERANEQGFIGSVPDPTPNENYTVEGVTSGKPTPETDEKAFNAARQVKQRTFKGV